jgi:hypothetical protein
MSTSILALLTFLSTPAHASSADCRNVTQSISALADSQKDSDLRSRAGVCLLRNHLDNADVNRAALRIVRDPAEDILLREDLIEAFSEAPLRHKVKLEGRLAPEMGQMEKDAVDRALSGAGSLLAAAQAVKTMEDTEAVSRFEADFFRALSDIALDDSAHVLLRSAAVSALEKISEKTFSSGVFDEKLMRLVRETLKTVAARDDIASTTVNAGNAYNHLAVAGLPGYTREMTVNTGRMISSVKGEK